MTMDLAGILMPKTVKGETAHLAMAPVHRVALESLGIIDDKITHKKDKSSHHGSGSGYRSSSKDAHDDITQSKIDKARRRRTARAGFDSEDSEETQEHDGELRGGVEVDSGELRRGEGVGPDYFF
jgi:hypothetical protein